MPSFTETTRLLAAFAPVTIAHSANAEEEPLDNAEPEILGAVKMEKDTLGRKDFDTPVNCPLHGRQHSFL